MFIHFKYISISLLIRYGALLSFLQRRSFNAGKKKEKVSKIVQYNRDVICLPSSYASNGVNSICIPRGKQLTQLAEKGLQGKVTLNSSMSEEEVRQEIGSIFLVSLQALSFYLNFFR